MKNGKNQLSPLAFLIIGIIIFTTSAVTVITVNSVTGIAKTFIGRSFSRFVSAHIWSTVFYIASYLAVMGCLIKFLTLNKPAKPYFILGLAIVFFVFITAVCPVGITGNGIVDTVHNVAARAVFISMMIHSFIGLFCYRKNRKYLIINLAVLAADLAILFIVLFVPEIFWSYPCVFELILIYFYFASLLSTVKRKDNIAK